LIDNVFKRQKKKVRAQFPSSCRARLSFSEEEKEHKEGAHQLTSLTNLGDSAMPAFTSTIEDRVSPMKSVETTASLVMPRMPCNFFFVEERRRNHKGREGKRE